MKKTFFWIITLLFPFLLLVLVEVFLWFGGYNEEAQNLFVEIPAQPDYIATNPAFVARYFPFFVPQVAISPFLKDKPEDIFRIFVMGGSSTQGFPYNFYTSFSSQLEQRLLMETIGLKVEVINLGMTAVNSFIIRDLSRRLMEYEPDAIIIYAGHNEFYGSFGVGSTQFGIGEGVGLKRLMLALKNYRLYQIIENYLRPEQPPDLENRTMMARVVKDAGIELHSNLYEAGIKQFEENMADVVELFSVEEIPVFMGTVASNLKDQSPLSDNAEAIEKYVLGNNLYDTGDLTASLEMFIEAKERDALRFRAPEEINSVIRKLSEVDKVTLVDVEKMLRGHSLSGIEDESLFIDHLHPNSKGHKLIADLFFEHLLRQQIISEFYLPKVFGVPDSISSFEQTYAKTGISRLLVGYPFQKRLTKAEELGKFEVIYNDFLKSSYTDSIAAFTKVNQKTVPLALNEVIEKGKKDGDTLAVMSHYYELLNWQLNSISLIEEVIEFAVNNPNVNTYLVNIIERVLNKGAYDPRYMNVLSSIYLNNRAPEKAKYWMDESLRLNSDEPILFYNLARYYLIQKDTVRAGKYYQKFLQKARG